MNIKNFKCTLHAINLAVALSLTASSNYGYNKEQKLEHSIVSNNFQDDRVIKNNEMEEIINKINNTVEDFYQKTKTLSDDQIIAITNKFDSYKCSVYYDKYSNNLTIRRYDMFKDKNTDWFTDENFVLSDNMYSYINLLLNQESINSLNLENVDFELSKLDISNLKKIELDNIKVDNAKSLMQEASKNGIKLNYVLSDMDIENSIDVVNYILENNINCNFLYLIASDEEELMQLCNLIEKVNSKDIVLLLSPHIETQNDININVNLNYNTSSFSLRFSYLCGDNLSCCKKLGNIEINSNNPSLSIGFQDGIITENTRFLVPDNSEVSIYGSYTDIIPFYDLRKISDLYYYDNNLRDGFKSTWPEFQTYSDFVDEIKEKSKVLVK